MKVKCSRCGAVYQINASKIPDKGAYTKCTKCQAMIFVQKGRDFQEAPPKRGAEQPEKITGAGEEVKGRERAAKETTRREAEKIDDKARFVKETKKCPFCGEEILPIAVKCKHCGSDLAGKRKAIPDGTSPETIGYVMLVIPLIATLLIWFWIGSMTMLQNPGSTLTFLGIATVVITAILGAYEANQLGFGTSDDPRVKKSETSPVGYFFGMILLWIVVYPIYLYQRSKKGKKNLIIGGILIALTFSISVYSIGSAIGEKSDEIRNIFNKFRAPDLS